ncbi:MAG: SocA family protein [Holophagales bacterium]|jgi:uncharacterized phage-associated protein|nr:SocA family protein [Holophagales bacterium]
MEHIKLMKLMYLADRESIDIYGFSISDDEYWSMKKGPVLSLALDLMSGYGDKLPQAKWCEWVSAKENYRVSLCKKIDPEHNFNELASQEIDVMEKVIDQFGEYDVWRLVDYTHCSCKEWIDPGESRLRITFRAILEALGKSESVIEAILKKQKRIAAIRYGPLPFPIPFVPFPPGTIPLEIGHITHA